MTGGGFIGTAISKKIIDDNKFYLTIVDKLDFGYPKILKKEYKNVTFINFDSLILEKFMMT